MFHLNHTIHQTEHGNWIEIVQRPQQRRQYTRKKSNKRKKILKATNAHRKNSLQFTMCESCRVFSSSQKKRCAIVCECVYGNKHMFCSIREKTNTERLKHRKETLYQMNKTEKKPSMIMRLYCVLCVQWWWLLFGYCAYKHSPHKRTVNERKKKQQT